MRTKRGTDIAMNTVVLATLALLVLFLLLYFYGGQIMKGFGFFESMGKKTGSEMSTPIISGYCGAAPSGQEGVEGTCSDKCANSALEYRRPLRGWVNCDATRPVCCKRS